jgi:hypothetical protein
MSACATIDAGSFVDRAADFSRYRTYNWAPPLRHASGDMRLEKNAVFQDYLHGELQKQFAARGLQGPTTRKPDLLIRHRAAVMPRMKIDGVEGGYGYCSSDCSAHVIDYEAATLVIDVVDSRTKKVIWRGWARDDLSDLLRSHERMARHLHQAVTQIMAKFPSTA